jgi:hypothetical protein
MPRRLKPEEINELASDPAVNRIAVENFLMSVHVNPDYQSAVGNLECDAASYGWSTETYGAIWTGIQLAFFETKETK